MTRFAVADARAMLAGTPGVVRALFSAVPAEFLATTEGPDTWSPQEVLAHLTDLEEQDWIPRLTVILQEGDARPLAPVDRVRFRSTLAELSVNQLLELFARRRADNLQKLDAWNLGPTDLGRRGLHPALGTVTLQQLLATWVVHDQTHLAQIVRIIAHQYADDVGPWKQYLGVLQPRSKPVP